ncbi:Pyridoxamine kinase/Phosphomethylpyrimidine kinase [Bartonella apis]
MALTPKILIVAGTDPTGGAGIVRDIETASHFSVRTGLAVTSVNVQDDHHVGTKLPMNGDIIRGQMLAALQSDKISAIKVGMTGSPEIVEAICSVLDNFSDIPVILDPVIRASSGGVLADDKTVKAIKEKLLKYCYLVTPNLPELAALTGEKLSENHSQTIEQAKKLLASGSKYVLAKGGHETGDIAIDSLVSCNEISNFSNLRLDATIRGTGCTLSTAIACGIAKGKSLEDAVETAKNYVYQLLRERAAHFSKS